MRVLDVREPGAAQVVIDTLRAGPVVLQLPPVYALMAPATAAGVWWLNETKQRLPGKNYGSVIGSMASFWSCVDQRTVPPELSLDQVEPLEGAFVRFRFAERGVNTPALRAGTHQGLLLPDPWRSLFAAVEAATTPEPELFGGHRFGAPLCTSFNRSGHPDGSIVDRDVALAFAREREIALFLTCEDRAAELGSYPIFAFGPDRVTIERQGPRLRELVAQLPPRIRPSLAA